MGKKEVLSIKFPIREITFYLLIIATFQKEKIREGLKGHMN